MAAEDTVNNKYTPNLSDSETDESDGEQISQAVMESLKTTSAFSTKFNRFVHHKHLPPPGVTYVEKVLSSFKTAYKFLFISDTPNINCCTKEIFDIILRNTEHGYSFVQSKDDENLYKLHEVKDISDYLTSLGIDFEIWVISSWFEHKYRALYKPSNTFEILPCFKNSNIAHLLPFWTSLVIKNFIYFDLVLNDIYSILHITTSNGHNPYGTFNYVISDYNNVITSTTDKKSYSKFKSLCEKIQKKFRESEKGYETCVVNYQDPLINNPSDSPEIKLMEFYFSLPTKKYDREVYQRDFPLRYILHQQWLRLKSYNKLRNVIRATILKKI